MITHIVNVVYPKRLQYCEIHFPELDIWGICRAHGRHDAVCDDAHIREEVIYSGMFFCENEDDSIKLSNGLAREFPGAEIYISKVTEIVAVAIGDIAVRKVTDKGVLPV